VPAGKGLGPWIGSQSRWITGWFSVASSDSDDDSLAFENDLSAHLGVELDAMDEPFVRFASTRQGSPWSSRLPV